MVLEKCFKNVYIALHNVYSINRVVELAKLVYGLGFENFIVTKAMGAAAQEGVPEAQKLAIKKGKRFFYLNDLKDAIEVLNFRKVYLILPRIWAKSTLDVNDILSLLEEGSKVLLVIGGSEPGLSKRDMELGEPVSVPDIKEDVGPVPLIAIALYSLLKAASTPAT
ncbi:MAG: exonuclease [Thermoprotei archaeon]|nr:MAG: exonuclease [Thermoprotei archaeon]RLF02745.1 MAG: exonuclease [Thermoprotei archaeon]